MDNLSPCIARMPEGEVSIKWFGRITIGERHNNNGPAIETIFKRKTARGQAAEIVSWIEVGFIPYLFIGGQWESGKYAGRQSNARRTVTINFRQNGRLIDAGYKISERKYLIPPFRYKIGEEWLQSKCVLVNCENRSIIIPCVEVLRFYYAQSSSVAKLLLSGNFSKELICNPKKSKIENGSAYLQVRNSIPDSIAPTIGRLVFSEYAMTCAQNIHKSIIKNGLSGKDSWFEAFPPLEEDTTIEIEGIELTESSFLATQIISCDHPFPFNQLFFTRDNDGGHVSDNVWESLNGTTIKSRTSKDSNKKNENRYFPQKGAKTKIYKVIIGRFSYLHNVKVKKIEKTEYIIRVNQIRNMKSLDQTGSVIKQDKSPEHSELEPVSLKRSKAIPASLLVFYDIIEALNCDPYFECTFVNLNPESEDANICTFPIVKGLKRELKWSYIDDYKTKRKCIVVRIRYHNANYYVFEAEQNGGKEFHTIFVTYGKDYSMITDVVLEKIMELCVRNRGRWLKDSEMVDIVRYKLKHTSSSIHIYASRIKALIKRSGGIINKQLSFF